MTLSRIVKLAVVSVLLSLQAQTPVPPPPAAGPTMEQAIASLNGVLTNRGDCSFFIYRDAVVYRSA